MTCDVTEWAQSCVKSQKIEYLSQLFLYRTETWYSSYTHHKVTLITKLQSVSRRSIICLSLLLRQIIDLLATDKSQYLAQSRSMIVKYVLVVLVLVS